MRPEETEIDTVTLFRPVGSKELALIEASGFRAFPPRLPDQPIFYPVTNEDYAVLIARDWNTKGGDGLGFVTRFTVRRDFISDYQRQIVGRKLHEEYWIPAEDVCRFNDAIVGQIEIIKRFTEKDRLEHERNEITHA